MRLGLVARGDNGGLGTLTREFARHLEPERVLGIDLGESGRGPCYWERFPEAMVNEGMDDDLPAETIRRFCEGLDVVYGAETWYRADFTDIARSVGCRTVLHAMPELWRSDLAASDVVWTPTTWEMDRLPSGTPVVPVPVVIGHEHVHCGDPLLYHIAAPAMLDRNGTHLLLDALRYMREPSQLICSGMGGVVEIGKVKVEYRPSVLDYWEAHPDEASIFVLPRRYAGLSLPLQEAAARAMTVVSLDLEPQRQWIPPEALVPSFPWRQARFPGGEFSVYAAEPRQLAAVLDRVVSDGVLRERLSAASLRHAATISWDVWAPMYRALLEDALA